MNMILEDLSAGLKIIRTSAEFKNWVRFELRQRLPHAAFLATVGKLYGAGSVPTHRIDVDFPLNMIEELKNSAGALDDPMMFGWFRTERLRYVEIANVEKFGGQQQWRQVLTDYGMRGMMIHGVLDHVARRFAIFQIGNPYLGGSAESIRLMTSLVKDLARAAWDAVDHRSLGLGRQVVGHPTVSLTPTELHIIELIAQGLSNKEIAKRRGVSDSTVKTQVQRTGAKLGATRRAEIVALALPMLSPLPSQSLIDYDDI